MFRAFRGRENDLRGNVFENAVCDENGAKNFFQNSRHNVAVI
jgi:hypothetical protein